MKTTNLSIAIIAATLLVSGAVLATETHTGNHGQGAAAGLGEAGKASEVTRTVEITMGDNFFEPESLSFTPGETVRFVIHNKGEFVHEFNLGSAAMHAAHQKEMMMMVEHGMLLPDRINHQAMMGGSHSMKHDDPNSILLEPGKSGEVIWKFGNGADIEFACNVPGHYDSGMVGRMMTGS